MAVPGGVRPTAGDGVAVVDDEAIVEVGDALATPRDGALDVGAVELERPPRLMHHLDRQVRRTARQTDVAPARLVGAQHAVGHHQLHQ